MKSLTIAALIAAQTMTVPAFAADVTGAEDSRMGVFGGLRVRVALDGDRREPRLRAGLTAAPVLHSRSLAGESRLRFGEGIDLGFTGRERLQLSIAGQDVRRLGAAQDDEQEDDDGGPSTLGWIAIGLGVTAVIVVGAAALCLSDSDCIPSE